jgi:HD-GYP domain-containing protein (c-di-GMP phosphodiesterase class II)
VGKIGISKELLGKKAGLDDREESSIQSHPDKGIQILEPVAFLRPILPTIRHHHESFDGTGYPSGLKGKKIPYKARILSIADSWDAMLSNRPYRKALSVEEATRELQKNAGIQFDPEIVEVFLKTLA